jgi:hypothetical protein
MYLSIFFICLLNCFAIFPLCPNRIAKRAHNIRGVTRPWKHILSFQGLGDYTQRVRSCAPLRKKQYKDTPRPRRRPGYKPDKEQTRRIASRRVSLLLHSLEGYCRVPQIGVPKLRCKTTPKKANQTLNYPVQGKNQLKRPTGSILPCWAFSKTCEQTSTSPRIIRGLTQKGLGTHLIRMRPQPWGLRHMSTHDNIAASSEPQKWHYLSPPCLRQAFDIALPLVRSRPPYDIAYVLASAQPNKPGMTEVKSPCRRP